MYQEELKVQGFMSPLDICKKKTVLKRLVSIYNSQAKDARCPALKDFATRVYDQLLASHEKTRSQNDEPEG